MSRFIPAFAINSYAIYPLLFTKNWQRQYCGFVANVALDCLRATATPKTEKTYLELLGLYGATWGYLWKPGGGSTVSMIPYIPSISYSSRTSRKGSLVFLLAFHLLSFRHPPHPAIVPRPPPATVLLGPLNPAHLCYCSATPSWDGPPGTAESRSPLRLSHTPLLERSSMDL
jgi:hypothetical protein